MLCFDVVAFDVPSFSKLHWQKTNLSSSKLKVEGLSAVSRRVELFPVFVVESADVVHAQVVADLGSDVALFGLFDDLHYNITYLRK